MTSSLIVIPASSPYLGIYFYFVCYLSNFVFFLLWWFYCVFTNILNLSHCCMGILSQENQHKASRLFSFFIDFMFLVFYYFYLFCLLALGDCFHTKNWNHKNQSNTTSIFFRQKQYFEQKRRLQQTPSTENQSETNKWGDPLDARSLDILSFVNLATVHQNKESVHTESKPLYFNCWLETIYNLGWSYLFCYINSWLETIYNLGWSSLFCYINSWFHYHFIVCLLSFIQICPLSFNQFSWIISSDVLVLSCAATCSKELQSSLIRRLPVGGVI